MNGWGSRPEVDIDHERYVDARINDSEFPLLPGQALG